MLIDHPFYIVLAGTNQKRTLPETFASFCLLFPTRSPVLVPQAYYTLKNA